jgi:spore coat polysaccharide biosynthesis predicted glycosyltransferase SpsG
MVKILFRCDGGTAPEIGSGHIYRCLSLAKNLVSKNIVKKKEVIFLTRNDEGYTFGKKILKNSGFNYKLIYIRKFNSKLESEYILKFSPNLVILDRLKTNISFIKKLKKKSKIITFDDYGSGKNECDLAINAIFSDVPKSNNLVRGYKYLILNIKKIKVNRSFSKIKNVFVSFGGHDKRNFLNFFLDNLDFFDKKINFKIIINSVSYNKIKKELNEQYKKKIFRNISFFVSPRNYNNIFLNCDLAICSGGLTLFEACALGVPTIALPQNKHQQKNIKRLLKNKSVMIGTKEFQKDRNYFNFIARKVIKNKKLRKKLSYNSKKLIDLKGLSRITNIIKNYL